MGMSVGVGMADDLIRGHRLSRRQDVGVIVKSVVVVIRRVMDCGSGEGWSRGTFERKGLSKMRLGVTCTRFIHEEIGG